MRSIMLCLLATVILFGSGCYTIHYGTSQRPAGPVVFDHWHHNLIFGLVEVSDPINVSQICPGGFALITNEVTFASGFLTGLVGGGLYFGGAFGSLAGGGLWSATNTEVVCGGGAMPPGPPRQQGKKPFRRIGQVDDPANAPQVVEK